ncbi:hypothetical protein LIER_21593 [Lithospermum erythrorhizon]|uniref:Uncharacterized protein n=1 Tax=Lithospermum erythrorhizon TaxID=34254 RepID=A0AAV3QSC2_LITER
MDEAVLHIKFDESWDFLVANLEMMNCVVFSATTTLVSMRGSWVGAYVGDPPYFRQRECPYAKVASPEPHLESLVTRSSNDKSSLSAKSPIPKVTVEDLVVSKITPIDDDVRTSASIKDKMSKSSETQADNYELRPRTDPNNTETSRAREMSLFPFTEQTTQRPVAPTTQKLRIHTIQGSVQPAAQGLAQPVPPSAPDKDEALYQGYLAPYRRRFNDPDLTPGYTTVYVESFSYGMRLPFSSYVNNLLISINRAPVN